MALVPFVTNMLAVLTVVGQAIIGGSFASLVIRPARRFLFSRVVPLVLPLALAAAVIATTGSLFFSEIAGYEPCTLCWYQRILMYPQGLLLGLAVLGGNASCAVTPCLMLSLGGMAVAAYHYLLQLGIAAPTSCAAVGYAVSCAERFAMTFGYITIPLMAFTAFTLIALAMSAALLRRQPFEPRRIS